MSMKWIEPEMRQFEYGKAPPVWANVLILLGFFIGCLVVTVLDWKQGKPVISAEFFVRVLVVPLLLGVAVCSLLYVPYEDWMERVDLWNNLRHRTYADWRWWAQDRVAVMGSVTLTPEKDLGARMLGLEGSPPANAGKRLALAADKNGGSMSRVQQVLEQLIVPFLPYIRSVVGRNTFNIVVQSDRDDDLNDLRSLLRRVLPREFEFVQLSRVSEPIDMGLIEKWLSGQAMPDYCMVLAWQLHATGKEPTCSEAAVSLLFASRRVVAASRRKLTPEAWIFRPAASAMDRVLDTLKTMLAARQVPVDRIKHLWLTHLPGHGRHAALTAVKDAGLNIAAHDLDTAIGVPGPVNTLLVQALAARMVQHGQGTQMIATHRTNQVVLNLVGTSIAAVENVERRIPSPFSVSLSLMIVCIVTLLMLLLKHVDASAGTMTGTLVAFVVILFLQPVFSLLRRNKVERDFYQGLPW